MWYAIVNDIDAIKTLNRLTEYDEPEAAQSKMYFYRIVTVTGKHQKVVIKKTLPFSHKGWSHVQLPKSHCSKIHKYQVFWSFYVLVECWEIDFLEVDHLS